jgi:hypothetical protein
MPQDAIVGYEEFILSNIDSSLLIEKPMGSVKPKHTFGRTPFFLKPDPVGGLPVRSSEDPKAFSKEPEVVQATSPALIEETVVDNPYDLGLGEDGEPTDAKVEVTTFKTGDSEPNPEGEKVEERVEVLEDEEDEDPVVEDDTDEIVEDDDDTVVEDDDDDTVVEDDDDETVIEADQGPKFFPSRTELRRLNVEELREAALGVAEAGCPLKPEMLETFSEFDENTTKGVMFVAMWSYFGYDEKE